jgi:hypothetical protein
MGDKHDEFYDIFTGSFFLVFGIMRATELLGPPSFFLVCIVAFFLFGGTARQTVEREGSLGLKASSTPDTGDAIVFY